MNIISKLICEILPPDEKIVIIDCGARYSAEAEKWSVFGDRLILYGFEPDQAECQRLNSCAQAQGLKHSYYPMCLAETDEENRKFFLTKGIDSSSLYRPNQSLISRWTSGPYGKVSPTENFVGLDEIINIPTTCLDTWAKNNNIQKVDFIKLDVQGAELEILKGGKKLLKSALGLEVEVEFAPLYCDQPLFADVDTFLRQQGFSFFQFHFTHAGHFVGRTSSPINIMHQGNSTFKHQTAGQLVTSDALYLFDLIDVERHNVQEIPLANILKLACISEINQQVEYAFELLGWLRNALTRAGSTHDAQIIDEIYTHATEAYKDTSQADQISQNELLHT